VIANGNSTKNLPITRQTPYPLSHQAFDDIIIYIYHSDICMYVYVCVYVRTYIYRYIQVQYINIYIYIYI